MLDYSIGEDLFPRNALAEQMTPEQYAELPTIEGDAEITLALASLTGYLNVRDELLEIQHTYANADFEAVNKDLIMMQVTRHLPTHMSAQVTIDDFASMESIKEKFAAFKAGAAALIDRIWTAMKNFFSNLFNKAERQYQQAIKIRDKVKAMKEPNLDSFKTANVLGPFMLQGFLMMVSPKDIMNGSKATSSFDLQTEGRATIDFISDQLKSTATAREVFATVGGHLEKVYHISEKDKKDGTLSLSLVTPGASGNILYSPKTNTFSYKNGAVGGGKHEFDVLKKFPEICLPIAEGAVKGFDQIRDKAKIAAFEKEIQALKKLEGLDRAAGDTARIVNFLFTYFKAIVDYQFALSSASLYLASSVRDGIGA